MCCIRRGKRGARFIASCYLSLLHSPLLADANRTQKIQNNAVFRFTFILSCAITIAEFIGISDASLTDVIQLCDRYPKSDFRYNIVPIAVIG